jgi:hypothetical protein
VVVDELIWLLAGLGSIVLLPFVVVGVTVRALVKRIRRSRVLSGAALRTRANLSTGPQRRVLRLRVRLNETLLSGQAAVDLVARGDGPRSELPRLFARIHKEGVALDAQLRLLESETDAAVLAEELPAATRRVELVTESVRRLRSVVATGLGGVSDDTLTALRSEVDREVVALQAGLQELHELSRRDSHFETLRPPSAERISRSKQRTES